MARTYKRDSKGRFAGTAGGGSSRRSEIQANNRRAIRAGDVYNQSGPSRRQRSAAKQAKGMAVASKAARIYAQRGMGLNATGGAPLGGKRKTLRVDSGKRSMLIGKRAAEAHNKKVGATQGTPEANKVGVKAMVQFNRQRRITQAAKRAGLGRRR